MIMMFIIKLTSCCCSTSVAVQICTYKWLCINDLSITTAIAYSYMYISAYRTLKSLDKVHAYICICTCTRVLEHELIRSKLDYCTLALGVNL